MGENEVVVQDKNTLIKICMEPVQIQQLIYVIRGQQVMFDSDLAILYQVETKRLNESVKRNIARFPDELRFQLTEEEYESLRSQFATSKKINESERKGGRRYLPYVFTEQGIAMLSSVLKSETAINVSIHIMRTFIEMRKYMANTSLLCERMTAMEERQITYQNETNEKFEQIFSCIAAHEEANQKLFFEGQIYDAFTLLIDLVNKAEKRIILIDNYVDTRTLNILAKKKENVEVYIYTVQKTRLTNEDVETFNQQYPALEVRYTEAFHDRFLLIYEEIAYHIGASLKDAGKKCFAVSVLNDKGMIRDILQRVENS